MLDLQAAVQERHERFVRTVIEKREVWGLQSDEGWCTSTANGEQTAGCPIQPFWSDRAYAGRCAAGEWSHYQPSAIPLFKFIIAWLTGTAEEGVLVGTNWNKDLVGQEVEPAALQRELIEAMPPDTKADFDAELEWVRKNFDNPSYNVLPAFDPDYRFPGLKAPEPEPPPPPPRPRPRGKPPARPSELEDDLLAWELPKKPWRVLSPTPDGTLVGVRFGKQWTGMRVHVIAPEDLSDPPTWVAERFVEVRASQSVAPDLRAAMARQARGSWPQYELTGPEHVELGQVAASSYFARAPRSTVRLEWLVIDMPGGKRVVELYSEEDRRWDNDRKEALNALSGLRPK